MLDRERLLEVLRSCGDYLGPVKLCAAIVEEQLWFESTRPHGVRLWRVK